MTSNDEIFFVAGGTLKASTPSYVERPADAELFEAVMDGQLCYVLTPRQMGKSSLMTRTSRKLQAQGIRTASIDLTSIGTQVTAQQWYTSIISQLNRQLNLGIDAQEWCKQQEGLAYIQTFTTFLEEIMLEKIAERVVIFIDEIDSTLSLNFRDDFFAGLRAIYNARTDKPAFERIAFVLLGVASPSDLIADKARTPFNIGRAIALQEFDFAHAHVLQTGLDAIYPTQGEPILQRIFHWTSGHPYLTQKLCSEIVERQSEAWPDAAIDQLVHELFLSEQARKETNLKFVQDRLLDNPRRSALLGLYQRILRGKVHEEGQSALQNELKLSGLVRVDDGLLKVRNLIYETVFSAKWAKVNRPKNWPKIAAAILAVFSFILLSVFIYDAVANDWSKRYAGEIATARTSKERLYSLYNLFELKGIFTPNYAYLARESFYPLPWDKQIGLFIDPHIDVKDKEQHLVPVIRGLYVTMANVPGGQDSTELLQVMYTSLNDVKSLAGQELKKEIGWWLKAREATTDQEALNNYNEAIALEADNPSTRFERAQVASKMGKTELMWSDLDTVIALAQNISTEANEKDMPTLTPLPIFSAESAISTQSIPSSATNVLPTITQPSNASISVTPQPEIHSELGYNKPRESYQSSFFSIAYIRSAVERLLFNGKLLNLNGDITGPSQPNKYPNLVSAGLLPNSLTTPEFASTKTNASLPGFEYQIRVFEKDTGNGLANAVVRIEIAGQAPLNVITDVNGIARIFINSSNNGQPARVIIEAPNYQRYTQNIDVRVDTLPLFVQLEHPAVVLNSKPFVVNGYLKSSACFSQGDKILVTATGNMIHGENIGSSNADGKDSFDVLGVSIPIDKKYYIYREYPLGALMCKLDSQTDWLVCGTSKSLQIDATGCLEFQVNDAITSGDSGAYSVTIETLK